MLLDFVDTYHRSLKLCITFVRREGTSEMTDEASEGVSRDTRVE